MIGAIDPDVWGVVGVVTASLISGVVAYRTARTGAASDREARIKGMTDSLLNFQQGELEQVRSDIAEIRQKHEDCLERESNLRSEVRHLTERVDVLEDAEARAESQRKLKHDWRSFAGSLYLERETTRRFLRDGRVDDVVHLLDHNDELRTGSPLLDDVEDLIRRDEP